MFYFQEINNINLYKSSIFDDKRLKHTFTTRTGGQTPYPLATLSMGTADSPELSDYVIDNRKTICNVLDIKYENLVIPKQKHTDNIKIVTSQNEDVSYCDGLITATPGLVLMLQFADCVPIIMYAPDKHVVSVVHAGWRGTAKSIVQKAIGILEKEFNANPQDIQAVIGPAIGQCCYPVSSEVADQLLSTVTNSNELFTRNDGDNLVNIDLRNLNARQLTERGVMNIDVSDKCTSCTNSIFYSYRAENGKTGRHAAIASLV
jgi:YfiH family protein